MTLGWHSQHDAGRAFAETSAELIALYGPRFGDTIPGPIPGSPAIVEALDMADVPLFAITNFSGEFWRPLRIANAGLFDRFRDIVVSGDEKLVKPDPAIFALALRRFGLPPGEALFVDDRADNVAAAEAAGMIGHIFRDASTLRADLVDRRLLAA